MATSAAPAVTPLLLVDATPAPAGIDYQRFMDCVHCGLCLSACPTYVETGNENDSPRGRIYLMRNVTDGKIELDHEVRRHLDLCLQCLACESACPSGVQYRNLIEPFKILHNQGQRLPAGSRLSWLQRQVLFRVTPSARRTRLALAPMRLLQRFRLDRLFEKLGLFRLLPKSLRELHAILPRRLQPHYGRLPEVLPAEGTRRARVALFTGCAADAFFPQTNLATARVLQHNGCEVWIPRSQVCCGALYYHAAQKEPAERLARANCEAFGLGLPEAGVVDAIITNAGGCGPILKDYGRLLADGPVAEIGKKFAVKVRDISEFLVELGPVQPGHPLPLRATYHDACGLCHAQQIRKPPRQLLDLIPGLELVPLPESEMCCGAAGSYTVSEPEMASTIGQRKARHILDTGAQAVFTGNVGCLLQIARHLRPQRPDLWVAHPIDALWASYSGQLPRFAASQPGAL
jgi:glycolate oxidase iron-sulfur subunit